MLEQLQLKNFKSFERLSFDFTQLNLLCGSNSVGKSSIIQAILLFKQNQQNLLMSLVQQSNNVELESFTINGDFIQLGMVDSLLYMDAQDDELSITVTTKMACALTIRNNDVSAPWKLQTSLKQVDTNNQPMLASDLIGFVKLTRYLSTNRIAPKVTYDLSDNNINNNSIGISGQFTAHYLAAHNYQPLPITQLKHHDSKTEYLLENVSNWLAQISENVEVNAKVINEANQAAITYQYIYGNNKTREITPLNVGFGVTHVLPIVTLLLTAKPDDILIIENPEAQLHPSGQAKLAELMCLVAANGVQLIVETHSDHILMVCVWPLKTTSLDLSKARLISFIVKRVNWRHPKKGLVYYLMAVLINGRKVFLMSGIINSINYCGSCDDKFCGV